MIAAMRQTTGAHPIQQTQYEAWGDCMRQAVVIQPGKCTFHATSPCSWHSRHYSLAAPMSSCCSPDGVGAQREGTVALLGTRHECTLLWGRAQRQAGSAVHVVHAAAAEAQHRAAARAACIAPNEACGCSCTTDEAACNPCWRRRCPSGSDVP
jgi:hypothetical protein